MARKTPRPKPIDYQSVITALTDGIGTELGRDVRRSFFRQYERLVIHDDFVSLEHVEKQRIADCLAIAAFYQSVIVPLESSGKFVELLGRAGASHLQLAKDRLDQRFANRAMRLRESFNILLTQANLYTFALVYVNLAEFIKNIRNIGRLSNGIET